MSDSPYITNVTRDTFAQAVLQKSRKVPVLVDFWADWCGPCHMLMPVLAELVEAYKGEFLVAKVNSDEQQDLAAQYGVRSLPTVKIFRNGEVVDEFMGAQPESVVREIIDRHIQRESDKVFLKARAALDTGDTGQALALLEQAAGMDPDNAQIRIEWARVLLKNGDPEGATTQLDLLGPDDRDLPDARSLSAQMEFARSAADAPDTNELASRVSSVPDDLAARYGLGARRILEGDFEGGMEQFLEIMRRDRGFSDDAGRKALLCVFDLLGEGDERVKRFRSKMFAILH
ncbi:MAG: thioredoxin [Pseudomonadota bacterium]|nr:thioredoxin [Pseudomonadota bacterium]